MSKTIDELYIEEYNIRKNTLIDIVKKFPNIFIGQEIFPDPSFQWFKVKLASDIITFELDYFTDDFFNSFFYNKNLSNADFELFLRKYIKKEYGLKVSRHFKYVKFIFQNSELPF